MVLGPFWGPQDVPGPCQPAGLPSASPPRGAFTGTQGQQLEKPRPPCGPRPGQEGKGICFSAKCIYCSGMLACAPNCLLIAM